MELSKSGTRYKVAIKKEQLQALGDQVIVSDMYFGEQYTNSGLIIIDDDKKDRGIHPRWAKVWALGPKNKDYEIGDWVFVSHGRWSRGIEIEDPDTHEITIIRKVDTKEILCKTKIDPRPQNACLLSDL